MALSEELKELYASSGTDIIHHTLSFNHSTWPEPVYIVSDFNDLQANLENSGPLITFQKFAFTIQGPNKDKNGSRSLGINVDNVSREIMDLLELAIVDTNQVPIEVVYRIYLESDKTGPQNDPPLTLYLTNVNCNNTSIKGAAQLTNLVNRKFPNVKYTSYFRSLAVN